MALTLDEYQKAANLTADYPLRGQNLLYPAIGCGEEAGEILGKVKKLWRNQGKTAGSSLTTEERDAILKELGDNLWYLAAMATELGVTLEEVAQINVTKLADRKARGVIKSEGDSR
jgi:NTP pyrophosphatase (non-canonical NTP hydrolase)